jgi:hypothetical protein
MSPEHAISASFSELATNIRKNIDRVKAGHDQSLDPALLTHLIDLLESKNGRKRPELPPPPKHPFERIKIELPPSRPTESQLRSRESLAAKIKQAKRALTSADDKIRTDAASQLKELRPKMDDLAFDIRISALSPDMRQRLKENRDANKARHRDLAIYKQKLARYQQETAALRQAIKKWDAAYRRRRRTLEYSTRLKIIEHLRRDVEACIRGEYRIPVGKLWWHFLPPGPSSLERLAAEIGEFRHRNPGIQLEEERLLYARSLNPTLIFVGQDEFEGYFAFVFDETESVLLENPLQGNAAYIFKEDWVALSKLPKRDLLEGYGHSVKRVLHRDGEDWKWRIRHALRLL